MIRATVLAPKPLAKLALLALCFCALPSFSYEVPVHRNISRAGFNEALAYRNFLPNLGISPAQKFNGRTPEEWVAEGADYEDGGTRAVHHFFDPITYLGLNGTYNGIPFSFSSAMDWAMDADNNPLYSIPGAFQSFHLALTAPDPIVRENAWASTFRAVGQFTHLLQDMGQPQHVRNNIHLSFGQYSDPIFRDFSRYERYTGNHVDDLNYYGGYPAVSFSSYNSYWSDEGSLANFTNKNFVSEGTNFGSGKYGSPSIASTFSREEILPTVTSLNGDVFTNISVRYVGNTFTDQYTGLPVTNNYLSAFSVFDFVSQQYVGMPVYTLTDKNHQAYADILIPRAVGHSAGLFSRFFRGNMDLKPSPYGGGNYVISNLGAESMTGNFAVYYDDFNGDRIQVPGASWSLTLYAGGSKTVSFSEPTNPAPKTRGKYVLVFKGMYNINYGFEEIAGKSVTLALEKGFPPEYLTNSGGGIGFGENIRSAGGSLPNTVECNSGYYQNFIVKELFSPGSAPIETLISGNRCSNNSGTIFNNFPELRPSSQDALITNGGLNPDTRIYTIVPLVPYFTMDYSVGQTLALDALVAQYGVGYDFSQNALGAASESMTLTARYDGFDVTGYYAPRIYRTFAAQYNFKPIGADVVPFLKFSDFLANGTVDLASDTIKIAIIPNNDIDMSYYSLTQIAALNPSYNIVGFELKNKVLTTTRWSADNVDFGKQSLNPYGGINKAVIYAEKTTAGGIVNPLIALIELTGTQPPLSTFNTIINWNSEGILDPSKYIGN